MKLDQDTEQFADYLAKKLPTLKVHLQIPRSSRCGEINIKLVGVQQVLEHYEWVASWTDKKECEVQSRDWDTTKASLQRLRSQLRGASKSGGKDDILVACDRVREWGGDRNADVGANEFLTGLADNGQLPRYLRKTKAAFDLTKDDPKKLHVVQRMNAMLTKVHALLAEDGLPIYDSRVAGAIATLAELYRREAGLTSLPEAIRFPTTGEARRRVRHFLPDARDTSHIYYGTANIERSTRRWTLAKWRLGRLLRHVLSNTDIFKKEGGLASRCHALEASLFMIGYDPVCLLTEQHKS